jgi:hypothetical protein
MESTDACFKRIASARMTGRTLVSGRRCQHPGAPTWGLRHLDSTRYPPDLQHAETTRALYAFHTHAGGDILRPLSGAQQAAAAGGLIVTCATPDLLWQHPDETLATCVRNS